MIIKSYIEKRTIFLVFLNFLIVTLLLQSFRNYSSLYFLFLFGFVLIYLFLCLFHKTKVVLKLNNPSFFLYILFIIFTFWIFIWSFIYNPDVNLFNSAGRLFFATILPFFFILSGPDDKDLQIILKTYVIIYVLGSLSFIYQILFGPISWFADEPMERGSVLRFSTILGSGNIYGIGLGGVLIISSYLKYSKFSRYFIIFILLVGALLSMQKAALVNVVLWIFFLIVERGFKKSIIIYFFILLSIFIILLLGYLYKDGLISLYLQEFVFNSLGFNLFDNPDLVKSTVLDKENFLERFVGLHLDEIFSLHNPILLIFLGVGVTGAGGGMGLPNYPQAHSTYWDLLFIGGILYLFLFLFLFLFVNIFLFKSNSLLNKILLFNNIIFFINAFTSSASIFQPVLSFVFWISVYLSFGVIRQSATNKLLGTNNFNLFIKNDYNN